MYKKCHTGMLQLVGIKKKMSKLLFWEGVENYAEILSYTGELLKL